MTIKEIKAIGNFLSNYYSDLNYLTHFKLYKEGHMSKEEYILKKEGSFYSFLNAFRVTRNFEQGKTASILELTSKWVKGLTPNDVDGFANFLNTENLTHKKIMRSLASKILFLNDPTSIYPMDGQARESLKQKSNLYSDYISLIEEFKINNSININHCLSLVKPFTSIIEDSFTDTLENLETIRYNRFMDILLWTTGE